MCAIVMYEKLQSRAVCEVLELAQNSKCSLQAVRFMQPTGVMWCRIAGMHNWREGGSNKLTAQFQSHERSWLGFPFCYFLHPKLQGFPLSARSPLYHLSLSFFITLQKVIWNNRLWTVLWPGNIVSNSILSFELDKYNYKCYFHVGTFWKLG